MQNRFQLARADLLSLWDLVCTMVQHKVPPYLLYSFQDIRLLCIAHRDMPAKAQRLGSLFAVAESDTIRSR